jgi:site-specific recombinase XerD
LKGITAKEAAEELVQNWFVKYLSGEKPAARAQKAAVTIEGAITNYVDLKKGALPPPRPIVMSDAVKEQRARKSADAADDVSDSIRKVADVLNPLIPFMAAKGINYLKDVKTEHLMAFQQTWEGRLVKDPTTKQSIQLPKSQHGKAKYQEYVKMFFKRARLLGWIDVNPAELLEPIRVEDPGIRIYVPEEKKKLLELIPSVFPNKFAMVRAFVLVQRFSALRISDTVALEVDSLTDDGVAIRAQRKTDAPVYCQLPPSAIAALRAFEPKSKKYFFWTGNGQLDGMQRLVSGNAKALSRGWNS